MIHWGLALAIAPNPNSRYRAFPDDPLGEGRKSIRTAKAGAAGLTSVERGLIEALDVLLDSDAERDAKARSDGFVEVAGRVFRQHPSDLEAAFLYGYAIMTHSQWAYWDADGKPYPRTLEAVEALERVMKNHPLHPGGNHLYIHLMEDSKEPQRALPQANRLEAIMPKAGHVVHMPSHIYMRVGQYQKAIQSNLRSVEADRYFLDVWGAAPFPQIGTYHLSAKTHFRHAHSFRRWAAMLQGDYRQAMEAARAAATIPREKWNSGGAQRTISTVWLTQSAFGKWHEVLATPQPPEEYPYLQGLWHFVRGSAYANTDRADEALNELKKLHAAAADHAIEDLLVVVNPAAIILELAGHALAGEIASARGRLDEAVASFEKAVALESALAYMEPPDWAQSMRLYLGQALLESGQPARAETVFNEDLKNLRENGWALHGLWHSLAAQGRKESAQTARRRFDEAWNRADVELEAAHF